MNHAPHTNGAPHPGGAHALRTKVTFTRGNPVEVKLAFDPPTEEREGRWGPQYMYFLDPHSIMFADPELHRVIVERGARAGDGLTITKLAGGAWSVKHANGEPLQKRPVPAAAPIAPTPTPAAIADKPRAEQSTIVAL